MKPALLGLLLLGLSAPVAAQSLEDGLNFDALNPELGQPDIEAESLRAVNGSGVLLKGLDKVSGEVSDVEIVIGESATIWRLEVTLAECRYPEDNPSGEAYAWLEIRDTLRENDIFEGWMIASSPALNALDHARYDVWVIRCTTA